MAEDCDLVDEIHRIPEILAEDLALGGSLHVCHLRVGRHLKYVN